MTYLSGATAMTAMIMTLERPKPAKAIDVADDPRWARIVARDRSADGQFWYSVTTTGVYCRPVLPFPPRQARERRVCTTRSDAKATGFRPCKRCKPDGPLDRRGKCRDRRQGLPADRGQRGAAARSTHLAQTVGRSPSHFHRLFKATTGLTPKDYAAAHRAARVREGLAERATA